MKISFIPRYGIWAASSRLRVFALAAAMNRLGLAEAVTEYRADADLLVVQKAVDPAVFEIARAHRGRVVYDVDDLIDSETFHMAMMSADLLTVDTEGRARDLRPRLMPGCRAKAIAVIPDVVDYESAGPQPVSEGEGAVWFGNYPNFTSVRGLMLAISANFRIGAVSDLSGGAAHLPGLQITKWNADTFPAELRQWAFAVLSHRGADPRKSVNKMAAAYYLGLPCLVEASDEYRELATVAGVEWTYILDDRSNLGPALVRMSDPTERAAAVAKVQPLVIARYGSDAVAKRALEAYAA